MADEPKNEGGQPGGELPKQEPATTPAAEDAGKAAVPQEPVTPVAPETAPPAPPEELVTPPDAGNAKVKIVAKPTIQEAYSDKFGHFNDIKDDVGGKLKNVTDARAEFGTKLTALRAEPGFEKHFADVENAYADYAAATAKHPETGALLAQEKDKALHVVSEDFIKQHGGDPAKAAQAHKELAAKVEESQKALDKAIASSESTAAKEFVQAQKNAAKFKSIWTGQVHARGVGGAIVDNFKHGSNPMRFGRVASVGVGAWMAMDALRSKTNDGQDRSWVTRVGEGALGVAGIAGGLMAGRARL